MSELHKTTIDLSDLKTKWPSSMVARRRVREFSGGVLNEKTLANLDSAGKGPARFRVGRQICYRVADLVAWMEGRATVCER